MKYVWAGEREERNKTLKFTLSLQAIEKDCGEDLTLRLSAADFFRVFIGGKLISYGPERAAAGYARVRTIALPKEAEKVEVFVSAYNISCYACDRQLPYFAVEVCRGGAIIAGTDDFVCVEPTERLKNAPKYSFQRAFLEVYDYRNRKDEKRETYEVEAPQILESNEDKAEYGEIEFLFEEKRNEPKIDGTKEIWWTEAERAAFEKNAAFDVMRDMMEEVKNGYETELWKLPAARTGFIKLSVQAETEVKIFALFEEILPDGEWIFRRSDNNDFAVWTLPAGESCVMTAEPYVVQNLQLLYKGKAKIVPTFVLYENDRANCVEMTGNDAFTRVFQAAKGSFCQNAVDIFTDCPGRERAGWLCDSFFTGRAETLFTGKNEIEKHHLENFIVCDTPELPEGMLPECFPAEHDKDQFIPQWAMWYVLELHGYFTRTGDRETAEKAKKKVYKLLDYFRAFENEYGLLEDLKGWLFVEWSVCNSGEYVAGVNFPSNMLFAETLKAVGEMYGDEACAQRSEKIKQEVQKLSFNGEFYRDNAIRKDGVLQPCEDHISETCQYYALYFGMPVTEEYKKKIKDVFGAERKADVYPEIGKSNMFIGIYLRLYWLLREREYDRVLKECLEYFDYMAKLTGTLWENTTPHASCVHGFTSVAAEILLTCLTGYQTVKNGEAIFDEEFVPSKKYGVTVTMNYPVNGKTVKEC